MKRFEIVDHTADIGIIAYGHDLAEAFANSAYAMFSLIADLDGVAGETCRDINVQAPDREALLVSWLNELLYLFDVEHIIFSTFEITSLNQNNLKARVCGEKVNISRHRMKSAVKAATYHLLKVEKTAGENAFSVQVILDV
jgi:SHS2 domain-containing protein